MENNDAMDDPVFWEGLGYNQDHAFSMRVLQNGLLRGISDLKRVGVTTMAGATPTNITITAGEILLPDDLLLPLWKEFSEALCSLAANQLICLGVGNIQLPKAVRDAVEPALKTAPIDRLILTNNMLGSDGINFLTNVLEANPMHSLCLDRNEIDCGTEMLSLLEAARNNTRLGVLHLKNCGIGRLIQIKPDIAPPLFSLPSVSLMGNQLGSHAASLISNCLASNPRINILSLDDNLLNDKDAALIANSLKTNENLVRLMLCGNNFTDTGIKSLYKLVYDDQSLNAMKNCNHRCELKLFAENEQIPDGIDEAVFPMNGKVFGVDDFPDSVNVVLRSCANGDIDGIFNLMQIEGRKKMKMIYALQGGNKGQFNMIYLNDVSLKLMPKVLAFVQECGKYLDTEDRNVDTLFEAIRATPGVASFCNAHDMMAERSKKRRLV